MTVEQMIKNGATPEEVLKEVTKLMNENDREKEQQEKTIAARKNANTAIGKYFATLGYDEKTVRELVQIFDKGFDMIEDAKVGKFSSFKLPSNFYKFFL